MCLGWSHYRVLLQVEDDLALRWYLDEAAAETWSVRTLQRNISSQYYERTLLSQSKDAVRAEMVEITKPLQEKLEFIKNPVIAEFLGVKQDTSFTENDLETAILDNVREFLMELGKGYAFVARQQHIHTEKEDYYIDLVFYNYILKCFVLTAMVFCFRCKSTTRSTVRAINNGLNRSRPISTMEGAITIRTN